MRKILAAPDSFKESMSASEACAAIGRGVHRVWPDAQVVSCPMADGGEGTLSAVLAGGTFSTRELTVRDAYGKERTARYGWDDDRRTALVEAAEACGLEHVPADERDVWRASSYGVGQLISQCLDDGANRIFLTLGGSATNDAGAGMLDALGVRFLTEEGNELPSKPAALAELKKIDVSGLHPRVPNATFEVAVDVSNPLLGRDGATYVFGPQKGAEAADLAELDQVLGQVADCAAEALNNEDMRGAAGAGAAGGLGWASLQFLGAAARPGVELVAELTNLAELMSGADLVFTGEGKVDSQTLAGKTPYGVAKVAQSKDIPVVLLAGSVFDGAAPLLEEGVTAMLSIMRSPSPLPEALAAGPANLEAAAEAACRLVNLGKQIGRSPLGN